MTDQERDKETVRTNRWHMMTSRE